jgi:hypothetical protein
MKIFKLFIFVFILTGCATLSREDCERGDWQGVGLEDGRAGEPAGRYEEHVKACSEFGIRVDKRRYLEGRSQGLIDYCHIENAFQTGLNGHEYQHVCPASIDDLFYRYNNAAYEVYRTRSELNSVEYQIRSKEDELQKKDLSDDKRRTIRSDIRDLDYKRGRVRDDLRFKEHALDRMMDEAGRLPPPPPR